MMCAPPPPAESITPYRARRERCAALASALVVLLALAAGPRPLRADAPVAIDASTRRALALDAHPAQGAMLFARHCRRCHGAAAAGAPARGVPALAGQRIPYLVHQLASFAAGERESEDMHRVALRPAVRAPQAWADLATYLSRLPVAPGGPSAVAPPPIAR